MWIDLKPYRLWETRTGAGPPVALLHGLSGSSNWWSKNIDALAQHHLVATLDLIGFGRSQQFALLPKVLPRFTEATALVARWLETFGEPVHLVGHSMGGLIAIRLAAERPDLIRTLTLVSPAGMPFAMRPGPHVRPIRGTPLSAISLFAKVIVPDFLRAGPASVAVATARIVRNDARAWMHEISAPTLLLWGAHDAFVPLAYGEAMKDEIPGARLEVIPSAAHVAMWEAPGEFNRTVLEFFESVAHRAVVPSGEGLFCWGIAGWSEGIAHRQSGRRRDVVLVHGLGMSSAYYEDFARALYARGFNPIACDLPGFGESVDARAVGPEQHATILEQWADRLGIRDAIWIGHSTGCHAVAHLAARRPDIARQIVSIGPLWTRRKHFRLRLFAMFAADIFRENIPLVPAVLRAYWRTGAARWLMTYRRHFADIASGPPEVAVPHTIVVGEADPIPDRKLMRDAIETPGAHACHFVYPEEVAEIVCGLAPEVRERHAPTR